MLNNLYDRVELFYSKNYETIRYGMIQCVKYTPYVLAFCVFMSYMEIYISYRLDLVDYYNGYCKLRTPITNYVLAISNYGEITWLGLLFSSVALKFCIFHQLPILYLGINLIERRIFKIAIIDETTIPYILFTNIIGIIIIGVLVYFHVKEIKNK